VHAGSEHEAPHVINHSIRQAMTIHPNAHAGGAALPEG
jgi:hypothetical protein